MLALQLYRVAFWSVWGNPSSIQSGSMDFSTIHLVHTNLVQPNDIVLDLPNQQIYWTDGMLQTIKYSDYNGRNVGTFFSDSSAYLFGITLDSYIVYFSDWASNTVKYIHKFNPQGPVLTLKENNTAIASGLEVIEPNRQPNGMRIVTISYRMDRTLAMDRYQWSLACIRRL